MPEEKTLDAAFTALKEAAEKELGIWLKAWPPPDSSYNALVAARQATAQAALDYLNVATSGGVNAGDNVKIMSEDATASNAQKSVSATLILIEGGRLTKEQLQEAFVFNEPPKGLTDTAVRMKTTLATTKVAAKTVAADLKTAVAEEKVAVINERTAATEGKTTVAEEKVITKIDAKDDPSTSEKTADNVETVTERTAVSPAVADASDVSAKTATKIAGTVSRADRVSAATGNLVIKPKDPIVVVPPVVTPPVTDTPEDAPKTAIGEFYSDLAEILTSLGEGIASAQRQLDLSAMKTQKEILEDELLSGYGLTANWYVMPEAEFTLKIELSTYKEEYEEGTKEKKTTNKILAALSNAKYNSLYKTEKTEESTLRVRFVPVPMPAVVKIPNVVGSTVEAARQILSGSAVSHAFIDKSGNVWSESGGVVIAQSIAGGEVMLADKTLVITAEVK